MAETITYTYDNMGRLTGTQVVHSGNDPVTTTTTLDGYDNRTNYHVSGSTAVAPFAVVASENGGDAGPSEPQTRPDAGSVARCSTATFDVTGNDTSSGGRLMLLKLAGDGAEHAAISGLGTIDFEAPHGEGSYLVTYTVEDAGGRQADGTLTVSVTGGDCSD